MKNLFTFNFNVSEDFYNIFKPNQEVKEEFINDLDVNSLQSKIIYLISKNRKTTESYIKINDNVSLYVDVESTKRYIKIIKKVTNNPKCKSTLVERKFHLKDLTEEDNIEYLPDNSYKSYVNDMKEYLPCNGKDFLKYIRKIPKDYTTLAVKVNGENHYFVLDENIFIEKLLDIKI